MDTLRDKGYRFCISPDKTRGRWISPIEHEKIYQDWADHTDTPEKEFIEFLQDLSESPIDAASECYRIGLKRKHKASGEIGDIQMTSDQERRVRNSIEEAARFIEKEEKRNPDLRPKEIQELLDFYKSHKSMLEGMLK